MEQKHGFSNIKKYEQNPFIMELKGRMFLQPRADTIIAKGQSIVDLTTGEIVENGVLIGKRKVVDKSQFAKIYASEIGILYELSQAGKNVFLYLTKIMDYDNRAYFNYFKEYSKLGYKSFKTCYNGLLELIKKHIIAADIRENTYWLNPTIVCRGERFAKYTEYVVGKDGSERKDITTGELAAQGKRLKESQPSEIGEKYERATQQKKLFDSSNNAIELE